jgi:hypothetical protein
MPIGGNRLIPDLPDEARERPVFDALRSSGATMGLGDASGLKKAVAKRNLESTESWRISAGARGARFLSVRAIRVSLSVFVSNWAL